MRIIENAISDRGSRYAVSGGAVRDRAGALAFLTELKRHKRFARATHNSWGLWLAVPGLQAEPLKGDDGEAGAGAIILKMQEGAGLQNHIIVVSRWYGGVRLGGDRFRHVQAAVRLYLAQL